jgi:hypothetical protein
MALIHGLTAPYRQAQELGLHRHTDIRQTEDNVEATLNLVWYDEYRRRVWINLFVWDR